MTRSWTCLMGAMVGFVAILGASSEAQTLMLKDKGIKTVVAMGTQARTSVLHTAGAAALRGFKVIVPVDGMSADEVFPELYTAWHLANAARIGPQVTLTKFDMIGF